MCFRRPRNPYKFNLMSKTKITTIFIILLTGVCFAQATDYIPLEPLPGTSPDQPTTLPDYLSKLIPIIISVAGILAVVIIVIAGLQYITAAGNTSQIASAKSRIWSAIGGLLLLISSYLILNTINPDLLKLDLAISPIEIKATCISGDCPDIPCKKSCAQGYTWDQGICACKKGGLLCPQYYICEVMLELTCSARGGDEKTPCEDYCGQACGTEVCCQYQ